MDALAPSVRTRRSPTGLTLLPGVSPPPRAPTLTPSAEFNPAQRYDAAGRPDVHGGSSANFRASVAADLAGAKQARKTFSSLAAPAVETGGTQTLTGTRPDGTTFTRAVRQTADAPQTVLARRQAATEGGAAGDAAAVASLADSRARFDATHLPPPDPKMVVAQSVADMNAKHGTLYETQGKVATQRADDNHAITGSLATKYDKEGDAARTRADNDTTRTHNDTTITQARADLIKQNRDRLAALAPVELQKLQQQVQLMVSQGRLADAHALLAGEQVQTEQQTRPGKVQALAAKGRASAAADPTYSAQRQHLDDEIARVRAQLNPSLTAAQREPIQKQLDSLLYQRSQSSGQRVDSLQAPAPSPAAAPPSLAAPAGAQQPPPVAPTNAAPVVGATAVNRQTGQRLRWTGTAWEAVQ